VVDWYLQPRFPEKKNRQHYQSTQAIIAGDLKHRLPVSTNRDELDTSLIVEPNAG